MINFSPSLLEEGPWTRMIFENHILTDKQKSIEIREETTLCGGIVGVLAFIILHSVSISNFLTLVLQKDDS